ncbi:hypothetical protein CW749_25960 [Vibrio sp. vnigr-6D03]|uniref:hypothetical protein n=1 Tax=Vibrio sp. vnigr-6D03 TaxID=2058088 RepID=UPI000C31E4DF|nr:hypothetical protein [Vibrio sp. vnigr-6D03]PKF76722.1 hypothetical protein CW749_25960 [Vibrio sp. vnigr-6D03]
MTLERKIERLEEDVSLLRKEGTKVSEDTRKALILDIKEKTQDGSYKSLSLFVGLAVAILSLVGYIGFESVKSEAAEYVVKSELKKQISNEFETNKDESEKILASARKVLEDIKEEKRTLEAKLASLVKAIDEKESNLQKISNVIAKYGVMNKDISLIVPEQIINVIDNSGLFSFLKSFGITEYSVLKLLATETEDFNFHKIDRNSIEHSVTQIQERYSLSVDGQLGPCSSLVTGALLLEIYEMETRKELQRSSYGTTDWLIKSFQTCTNEDKDYIARALEYPELPLHGQLNRFISAARIPRKDLLESLRVSSPLPEAYKALDWIGYDSE